MTFVKIVEEEAKTSVKLTMQRELFLLIRRNAHENCPAQPRRDIYYIVAVGYSAFLRHACLHSLSLQLGFIDNMPSVRSARQALLWYVTLFSAAGLPTAALGNHTAVADALINAVHVVLN